jgi:hypothetical protein
VAKRIRREKLVRDFVRLEVAAIAMLASEEKSQFCQDILARVKPSERSIVKNELRSIAEIMRTKVNCVDEA